MRTFWPGSKARLAPAVLALLAAPAFWMAYQARLRLPAPAFGGSDLSVMLADNAHFMQNDPRWSAERLGGTTSSLAAEGCAIASVAMAMTNLGLATDPKELNAALAAEGGFTERGWLVWDAIRRVTKGAARADVHFGPSRDGIDGCLARGDYPIVKFLIGGAVPHWVVLVGKQNGQYLMRDPLIAETAPIPLTRRTPVILSVRCIGRAV